MIYCRGCGQSIHESAESCPKCGCKTNPSLSQSTSSSEKQTRYGLSIASLVLGILCMLTLFDDSDWDLETKVGVIIFAIVGLVLGISSISTRESSKGMAIAGIILCSVSALAIASS